MFLEKNDKRIEIVRTDGDDDGVENAHAHVTKWENYCEVVGTVFDFDALCPIYVRMEKVSL